MTWSELEAWAKRNGFTIDETTSLTGWGQATIIIEEGITTIESENNRGEELRESLCRAVERIRKAK